MAIPSELQNLIQEALELVYRHPQHDLNLGYRHAIWAAFGDNGHLKRTALALSTVSRNSCCDRKREASLGSAAKNSILTGTTQSIQTITKFKLIISVSLNS